MVGFTGFKPTVEEPMKPVNRDIEEKKFIPGYKGFVPKMKSGNVHAQSFGALTKQIMTGNVNFGQKDNEFDNVNAKDKFISTNNLGYKGDNWSSNQKLIQERRPASAAISMPGYTHKVHNQQLKMAELEA